MAPYVYLQALTLELGLPGQEHGSLDVRTQAQLAWLLDWGRDLVAWMMERADGHSARFDPDNWMFFVNMTGFFCPPILLDEQGG